jgi:glutamate 5-kinase
MSENKRDFSKARSVIVKVGSKALATGGEIYASLASDFRSAMKQSKPRRMLLVSSGAIALGLARMGLRARPKAIAKLQAAAAVGQSLLMGAYEEAFAREGLKVAQVLLTHSDLASRERGNNARAALAELQNAGIVPIINENDSVAVEEIRFGDNDQLAAMIAPLVSANLLLLLSDVDGLQDKNGNRVRRISNVVTEAAPLVRSDKSDVGTGGMQSKIEAARRATLAGADVVIADARSPQIVTRVLAGDDVGSHLLRAQKPLSAKRHWVAFTLKPRGDLIVDPGCSHALRTQGKSILAVGLLGVRGDFRAGDAVRIVDADAVELGRGIALHRTADCAKLAGDRSGELIVHRNDLIVFDHDG